MTFERIVELRANLKLHPKAKPLAQLLVAEAARQEVTLGELTVATMIAVEVYKDAMDQRSTPVKGFEGEAKASLESI